MRLRCERLISKEFKNFGVLPKAARFKSHVAVPRAHNTGGFSFMQLLHTRAKSRSDDPDTYSDEELNAFNREHDRKYGWSFALPMVYTNPFRLPEFAVAKENPWS